MSANQQGPADADTRIAELESRLEFQDATIQTLNDELVLHHQRLHDLEKKVQLMIDRWPQQGDVEWASKAEDEPPPPHY
ncbi:MAG: SlyX family protein [Pseudomonadota bacterium]